MRRRRKDVVRSVTLVHCTRTNDEELNDFVLAIDQTPS